MEIDLSGLPQAVRVRLKELWSADFERKLKAAIRNQDAIAKEFHDNPPAWRDGLGARTMSMDPLFRWLTQHWFGDDTRDPEFWKWFRNRYDQFKVKAKSPKIQTGYRAAMAQPFKKVVGQRDPNYGRPFDRPADSRRFVKTYATA